MKEDVIYMRLLILFDLPTGTAEERKAYTTFRKLLLSEGLFMLQYSAYARCCRGMDIVNKELKRVKSALPPTGSIRALVVTDKQYCGMEILVGTQKEVEKIGAQQLCLF